MRGADAGAEDRWFVKYSIDQLKLIAAENEYSAFVTYCTGVNKDKVFWKKVPHQLTAAHLIPDPLCDGTWIRNLNAVGEVKTLHANDPTWGFVAKQAIPGKGDVPGVAPMPLGSLSDEDLKVMCVKKGYSAFIKYPATAAHALKGRVVWKKFPGEPPKEFFKP